MNIPWYDYLFMLCLGLASTYVGVVQKRKRAKLLYNGINAEGEVTELIAGSSIKNSAAYYPVIRFLTQQQEWVTRKYDIGGSANVYHVGDKLSVLYDPENHANFTVNDTRAKVAGPLFTVIGIIILSFDFLLLMVSLLSQIKTP